MDEAALAEERLVRSQWEDMVERFATGAMLKFNRTLPDFAGGVVPSSLGIVRMLQSLDAA